MSNPPAFKRVLLKLSGEALMGSRQFGIDPDTVLGIAQAIAEVSAMGVEIGLVIGGGNFFRGVSEAGKQFDRGTADSVGMLATVMNALIFQDALEKLDLKTRVMTAIPMHNMAEPFIRRRALRHLDKGRIVMFAAGTGHPYFSTDTGAALRALEIKADAILKGTKVDGVYTADPVSDPTAKRYDCISYQEVLEHGLRVMDQTAIALCSENKIPVMVFSIRDPRNLVKLIQGEKVATLVS
ncbi:MAG: UMP kinase [Myxococcota bacterium]|jgi:uridylate kinase|nr:UMP kinase [Myxococcota bacterium]HQL56369.1 UMP kinase [Myxococcota bacterium]